MYKRFCLLSLLLITYSQVQAQTKHQKKLLQGPWFGQESDEAAVFSIDGDTIQYIDDFSKFKYTVHKDTFELKTNQPHYKMIILKLTEDSLIFKDLPDMKIERYWKS